MECIGRYLVTARLGSGAFATVFRADDPVLDQPVAIKLLADNWADDPATRARFINEARVMRRLASPRVAAIHDIAELPDGRPYLVMQLATRGTLEDRLPAERRQAVAPSDVAAIVRGLGEALSVIHDAGVVHRDVKPSNILIDVAPRDRCGDGADGALLAGDEFVMLADFGMAKSLDTTGRLTMIGGTATFMAPEQRIVGAPIDGRADLYAATAVVAELLDAGPWPPVTTGVRHSTPALEAALARGLAEAPADRYPDAMSWVRAITAALPAPLSITASGPADRALPAVTRPVRRRRRVVVGAVLALLVAAGGAVAAWGRGGGADEQHIVGPAELSVGQVGVYYARLPSTGDWVWTAADGSRQDGGVVSVEADTIGPFEVTLEADDVAEHFRGEIVAADPQVGIVAPARAAVGDEITFRAAVEAGTPVVWRWGDRRFEVDELVLRAETAGILAVELDAELADGTHTVSHTVSVVP